MTLIRINKHMYWPHAEGRNTNYQHKPKTKINVKIIDELDAHHEDDKPSAIRHRRRRYWPRIQLIFFYNYWKLLPHRNSTVKKIKCTSSKPKHRNERNSNFYHPSNRVYCTTIFGSTVFIPSDSLLPRKRKHFQKHYAKPHCKWITLTHTVRLYAYIYYQLVSFSQGKYQT